RSSTVAVPGEASVTISTSPRWLASCSEIGASSAKERVSVVAVVWSMGGPDGQAQPVTRRGVRVGEEVGVSAEDEEEDDAPVVARRSAWTIQVLSETSASRAR